MLLENGSFIKIQTSDISSDNEWQQVTMTDTISGSKWQEMTTTKYNNWLQVAMSGLSSENEWQRMNSSCHFDLTFFLRIIRYKYVMNVTCVS